MTQTPSTFELWLVDLEDCAGALEHLETATPRLTAEDRARAHAIDDLRDRNHRLAAYTALRVLLERIAGPGVRERPIVRVPGGKPRLDGGGAEFSLSHIDGLALIGVSSVQPLGVDLERTRPIRMSPRRMVEILAIGSGLGDKPLPPQGSERTFLQAWARLEAFAKARGRGLAQTLTDVGARGTGGRRAAPADLEVTARRIARGSGFVVHDIAALANVHAAVAASRGTRPVRARALPTDPALIERLLVPRGVSPQPAG